MKYLHDVVKHHKAQHVRTYGATHACSRSIFSKEFEFIGSTLKSGWNIIHTELAKLLNETHVGKLPVYHLNFK